MLRAIRRKFLSPVIEQLLKIEKGISDLNANVDMLNERVDSNLDDHETVIQKMLVGHVESAPSINNIIEIFGKNAWGCKIPLEGIETGAVETFTDSRIDDLDKLYPIAGKNVLELGPMECGHTYMLDRLGAKSITSIESSKIMYLKCLVVKDIFKIKVDLQHGDFREYLRKCNFKYDIVLASGVLYHMTNPVELIYIIAKVTECTFLWTHYYDMEQLKSFPNFEKQSTSISSKYSGYKQYYPNIGEKDFYGGTRPYSIWMERDDILSVLEDAGFDNIFITNDTIADNGLPHIAIFASKSSSK